MKHFFTVFKFEFFNFLKNKVFITLTFVMLFLITVLGFSPRFVDISGLGDSAGETKPSQVLIVDKSGVDGTGELLKTVLVKDSVTVSTEYDEASAKESVDKGDYGSAIVITSPLEYTYIVKNLGLYDNTSYMIDETLLQIYKNNYLAGLGLNTEQIAELASAQVSSKSVIVGQDQTQSFMHAYVLMMVLYITVLIYGQLVAQSVAAEKSSRTMELLITSAKPSSLIFGKVLGTGFAGLLQISIILVWSLICIRLNKSYWETSKVFSMFSEISGSLILFTIIFFLLGFLLYAFLLGAMGSMASKLEDVGTLTLPVMFLLVIGFVATIISMSAGKIDSILIKVLSYIPFTAPMAMFARLSMGTANLTEAIISIAILIASVIGIGYVAVAVYRVGILMYGKPPKLNEIVRAVRKSK